MATKPNKEARERLERWLESDAAYADYKRINPNHHLADDIRRVLSLLTDRVMEERYGAGRAQLAAPGDVQHDIWILMFDDPDRGTMFFGGKDYEPGEAERLGWEAWNRYAPTWNCRLFRTAGLTPEEQSGELVERILDGYFLANGDLAASIEGFLSVLQVIVDVLIEHGQPSAAKEIERAISLVHALSTREHR